MGTISQPGVGGIKIRIGALVFWPLTGQALQPGFGRDTRTLASAVSETTPRLAMPACGRLATIATRLKPDKIREGDVLEANDRPLADIQLCPPSAVTENNRSPRCLTLSISIGPWTC